MSIALASLFKNDLTKIALYFLATILVGAAISPAIFMVGKAIGASGTLQEVGWMPFSVFGSEWTPIHNTGVRLAETDFPRYFNRAMLAAALICMVPLIRWMRVKNWRSTFALEKDAFRMSRLFGGFALAGGLLLTMGWGFVLADIFDPRDPAKRDAIPALLGSALLAGVSVGLIEEFLFRGVFLGVGLRAVNRFAALFFVTTIFAGLHLLKPPGSLDIPDGDVDWGTGFWLAVQCFTDFKSLEFLVAEYATLFAVGWILGLARLRTGSLWVAIGLHAGWVFGLKTFSGLATRVAPLEETLPWVGKDLKNGVVSLAVVILTGWLVHRWLREAHPE